MRTLLNKTLMISMLSLALGCGSEPIPGPQGIQGVQGEPGSSGLPGASGSDADPTPTPSGVSVVSYTQCSKLDNSLTNNQSLQGISMSYSSVLYSNGDSFVTCSVYDRVSQSTNTLYKMHGKSNGHCIVNADLSNYNSGPNLEAGSWVFNDSGALPSITYIDSNNTKSGYNVGFITSECSVLEQ